ncbi:Protein of unknown function (DUF3129) [Geosmithia morbida]|uniref:GEgh 16 protein n=1 Tax=Geosmithia morbida TaxID=1094350 RepID=A0A9P4YMC0_9HYPO|nr:Protein of unknown function (DUF3129) [Geosmithia morbida]KAF4119618.1 Protein of unknown function (DUF3129) [Geosmithia morbida]
MYYSSSILPFIALIASVHSHGVILKAQGDKGESQGFLLNDALPRNCTEISPCQLDSTIIRDAEIKQNIVNGCGRTELSGNIDIGEQTENEIAANRITSVQSGSTMEVTIHQVNADGAGPYECDIDMTSNSGTFTPLKVTNNIPGENGLSQAKEKNFTIEVQMPDDLDCIGASTGNICTVRCRNNALAGPFGGCVAVQQTDNEGRTNETAAGVDTKQSLEDISEQIQVNKDDLSAALAANQAAGAADGNAGASAIAALTTGNPTATDSASEAQQTGNSDDNNDNNGNQNNNNNNNNNGGNSNAFGGGNFGGGNFGGFGKRAARKAVKFFA